MQGLWRRECRAHSRSGASIARGEPRDETGSHIWCRSSGQTSFSGAERTDAQRENHSIYGQLCTRGDIDGVKICRPKECLAAYAVDVAFIAAGRQAALWQMMRELLATGVRDIWFLQDIAGKNRLLLFWEDGEIDVRRLHKLRF